MTGFFSHCSVDTPLGPFVIVSNDVGAVEIAGFHDQLPGLLDRRGIAPNAIMREQPNRRAVGAIEAYFDGELDGLSTVATHPTGTPFQLEVWSALQVIPAGSTRSYAELAAAAGHPTAPRAAGTAIGANVLTLLIPCHRVVPVSGGVGGYSAGPSRKRWLLEHEAAHSHRLAGEVQAVGSST